jgi:hypothetical protein
MTLRCSRNGAEISAEKSRAVQPGSRQLEGGSLRAAGGCCCLRAAGGCCCTLHHVNHGAGIGTWAASARQRYRKAVFISVVTQPALATGAKAWAIAAAHINIDNDAVVMTRAGQRLYLLA